MKNWRILCGRPSGRYWNLLLWFCRWEYIEDPRRICV